MHKKDNRKIRKKCGAFKIDVTDSKLPSFVLILRFKMPTHGKSPHWSMLRYYEHRLPNLLRRADLHLALNHITCPVSRQRERDAQSLERIIKSTNISHEFNSNAADKDRSCEARREEIEWI
jgi:hypothetical protein